MTDILCFRFGVKLTFGTTEIEKKIIVIEINIWGYLLLVNMSLLKKYSFNVLKKIKLKIHTDII